MNAARRRLAGLAAVVACSLVLVQGAASGADPRGDKNKVDQRIEALHAELEGTSADLAEAYLKLRKTQALLPAAQARLASAQAAESKANAYNDQVAAELRVAQADEARANETVNRTAAELEDTQAALDSFAADLFQGGGESQLSVALGATSPDDFATKVVLADTVTDLTNQALDGLAAKRAESAAQQSYLTAVRAEVAALKVKAERALAAARAARVEAQSAKAALDTLVAQQTSYAKTVAAKKAGELARLRAAEAEAARLARALGALARRTSQQNTGGSNGGSDGGSSNSGGYLNYPANGPITSEFGLRYHPILHYWRLHAGMDFGIACGTPVYAPATGRVISAGGAGGYGNRIMIDHGIVRGVDLVTTFNHLSKIVRGSGTVSRGQLIGYSGETGLATGCHLHFETRANGTPVNPRRWI